MKPSHLLLKQSFLLIATVIFFILGVIIIFWPWLFEHRTSNIGRGGPSESFALDDSDDLFADEDTQPTITPTPEITYVIVNITGAVRYPDAYKLPSEARVKDVVLAAGGFSEDVASDYVNLAAHISDGQHIHIPRQGEITSAPLAELPRTDASPSKETELLNINTASAADLEELPRIGPALAQRIVEYREANGPFQSIEDLQQVSGVGPALIEQIEPLITVGP